MMKTSSPAEILVISLMKKSMPALFRGYIVPSSSDTSLPAVPNYFLEGKSAKCEGTSWMLPRPRCHATNFRTMELLRLCMMGTRTRSRVPITAVRFKCTQKGTAILEEKLLEQTLRPRSSTSALYPCCNTSMSWTFCADCGKAKIRDTGLCTGLPKKSCHFEKPNPHSLCPFVSMKFAMSRRCEGFL